MSETEIKAAIAQQEEHLKRIRPCQGRMLASHQFEPHRPAGHIGSFHRDEVISRCIICGVTETDDDYQRSLQARAKQTPETERHDYEPGDATDPMHTDPLCRVCGRPAKDRSHD